MKGQAYERWIKSMEAFRGHGAALRLLLWINRLLTFLGFLSYPLLLAGLFVRGDGRLFPYLAVPALSFVLVSWFRRKLNRPRPYEKLKFRPLIPKDTRGRSFPSRHIFSIFLIAGLWWTVFVPAGIFLVVCGVLLALIRVAGGVHFPSDVCAGAAFGLFFAFCSHAAAVLAGFAA